jgi:phage-related protein
MANDVEIVVTASVGDALVKLGLAEKAVKDLGDTNASSAVKADENTRSTHRLSSALNFLTSNWKTLVPVATAAGVALLGFTGHLGVLLPLLPVLTVALAGLIAPFTSLAAVLVALVAPLSLLGGLLGLLGAGFFFAAKQAFGKGGGLADAVAGLTKQFHELVGVLVQDFMPIFRFLISSASDALTYLTKIAKLPLKDAFQSLSTTGVEGLTHFLDKVGSIVAKPIRLAFDIAFGPQGGQIRNSLLKIWTQIQQFFEKPPSTGGPSISQEVGAWFGRQDFTGVGMRWAMELASSMVSALGSALRRSLGAKILAGGLVGGTAIGLYLGGPIGAAMGAAIGLAVGIALNHYWPKIRQAGIDAFHDVQTAAKKALGPALWNSIISLAKSFWNWLEGIGHVITGTIWPAVKKVWDALGGWHTVIVIIVGAIRVVAAALVVVGTAVREVYDAIKRVWTTTSQLAGVVGGALLGAFQAVAGVVSGIVGAINSAVGAAQSLAGALGGAGGGTTGRNPVGGGVGFQPGNPTGKVVAHFHYHAAPGSSLQSPAERAAFERTARRISQSIVRQGTLLGGGN